MFFSLLLGLAGLANAANVFVRNEITYYSPDLVETKLSLPSGQHAFYEPIAVTLMTFNESLVSSDMITSTIEDFKDRDDVYSDAFLQGLVITHVESQDIELSSDAEELIASFGCGVKQFTIPDTNGTMPGPYLLHPSGKLTRVYRMHWDYNAVFAQSVTEGRDGTFLPVMAAVADDVNGVLSAAVPSRLYYPPPSEDLPLSGLRLVLKDIIDLKGIRSSSGSRSWRFLRDPAEKTAPAVQDLIDLGAVVIGKVKTSQFASAERPTADAVDQLYPFNPRGDNYQIPESSSSGSGASVASYDWIDLAMGSDTGGSVRLPAGANGVFGMRISNGSQSIENIVPISPAFDTPGLLARDIATMQTVHKHWLKQSNTLNYTSFPKRIIMPEEWWPPKNGTSLPLYEDFISKLANYTGAIVESKNLNDSFKSYTGHEEGIIPYQGRARTIYSHSDSGRLLVEPYYEDFMEKFGYMPFVNPTNRIRFSTGPNYTQEEIHDSWERIEVVKDWWLSDVLPTCESTAIVVPFAPGIEEYRDVYLTERRPNVNDGFDSRTQTSIAGVPDIVFPIGERTYFSRITQQEEKLPVSISVIVAPGCDNMLLDMVQGLAEADVGFRGAVKAGRTLW